MRHLAAGIKGCRASNTAMPVKVKHLYRIYKQLFLRKVFLPFTILYILTCPYTSEYVYYQDHQQRNLV